MRIALIASYGPSLINFRGDLIKSMVGAGHEVFGIAPEAGLEPSLAALGAKYVRLPMNRTGTSLREDCSYLFGLVRMFHRIMPQMIFSYTIKPVIYGTIAGAIARVPARSAFITGLGYSFSGDSTRSEKIKCIVMLLYKISCSLNQHVFFQNSDDMSFFTESGTLNDKSKAILVNGSGVNLEQFQCAPFPQGNITFLLIARLLRTKGIIEYAEAARAMKARYPYLRFILVGPWDNNPSAIARELVEGWVNDRILEYIGEVEDVRPYLRNSHVYVLPSYREGTPRSVLEAMAMGRPVITSDAPGCRETVTDGWNGFLVPVGDAEALEKSMENFIRDPKLIVEMGKNGRELAEKKYDVNKVNEIIMRSMGLDAQANV